MLQFPPPPTDREQIPVILDQSLSEDEAETPRASRLMVLIEIAMVAIAVIAAALLCVGAWWWLRV